MAEEETGAREVDEGANPEESSAEGETETDTLSNYVSLPSGKVLRPSDVDSFLRRREAKLIAIVGEKDAGKTTLISSIFERFMRGTFAGFSFAGSKTLVAFDELSFLATTASGLSTPDTKRTTLQDELGFLHLSLASEKESKKRYEFMLSDRSGETYRRVREGEDDTGVLIEVPKADCLVLLLDGELLTMTEERTHAMQVVRNNLRIFVGCNLVGRDSFVQVVTTKKDILEASGDLSMIRDQLREFEKGLNRDYGNHVKLSSHEIAARDPKRKFGPAYGVDRLLKDWCSISPRKKVVRQEKNPELKSEFDLLMVRPPVRVAQ